MSKKKVLLSLLKRADEDYVRLRRRRENERLGEGIYDD